MVTLSTAPQAFIPAWTRGTETERRYFMRPGDVIERANFEAELAGEHRAGRVFGFELKDAFVSGVTALLADRPDDAAALIALADAEAAGDPIPPDEMALLEGAREQLEQHWPAYRAVNARAERRRSLLPIVAFQRFCAGWDGPGLPAYEAERFGGVTRAAMAQLPAEELAAAGVFAYSLLYIGGQEKNSAPPLQSDNGPETSISDNATADGSSAAKDGTKTRSSRSRRKSSRSSTSGSTAAG